MCVHAARSSWFYGNVYKTASLGPLCLWQMKDLVLCEVQKFNFWGQGDNLGHLDYFSSNFKFVFQSWAKMALELQDIKI